MNNNVLDYIKEFFRYKEGRIFSLKCNRLVGFIDPREGYRMIKILGNNYPEHRIIFYMHYGYLPNLIDHKNRIRDDNRIENLRKATRSQNTANSVHQSQSKVQYKGIDYRKDRGYRARCANHHIGYFDTAFEAAKAYDIKAKELFGEYAKLNIGE